MSDIASSLRGARAYLDMNIKSVSSALRISDKTLTALEKYADEDDPKVAELIDFYENLGLRFVRENGAITGILHSDEVRKLVISASNGPNPDEDMENLRKAIRIINGLVFNLRRVDRSKADIGDTMEVHFPTSARDFVVDILKKWSSDKPYVEFHEPDGSKRKFSEESLRDLF
jgi:hypothetical protein